MVRDSSAESPRGPTCDRCGESLDETRQSRLSVEHEGTGTERYVDVDRRVCVDCVAALGMLEFERDAISEDREAGTPLRDRLSSIRSGTR